MSILVLAEHRRGELRDVTTEMVNLGNRIAKENSLQLCVLLLGADEGFTEALKSVCDRIIVIDSPELKDYSPDPYIKAIKKALTEALSYKKDIVKEVFIKLLQSLNT